MLISMNDSSKKSSKLSQTLLSTYICLYKLFKNHILLLMESVKGNFLYPSFLKNRSTMPFRF